MFDSDLFTLMKIKRDIEEIASKHGVQSYQMLGYCINKYTDDNTSAVFYHNNSCSCNLATCVDCKTCQEAKGHSLLDEFIDDTWKTHTEEDCQNCLLLQKIYFAQSEMVCRIPKILGNFPARDLEADDSCFFEVITLKCLLQADLSTLFGGRPRVKINGASLCEETAYDIMIYHNGFEELELDIT